MLTNHVTDSFKNQSHAMYLDTSFNSTSTVISNIHSAFTETATKMWTYAKCLPPGKQPGTKLLTKTITDLAEMAYVLIKSKGKNKKHEGYQCALKKAQVEYLALNAFRDVLKKRQSKYGRVLSWLEERLARLGAKHGGDLTRMNRVVRSST